MLQNPPRPAPRPVPKGVSVIGADGRRLGMVSGLTPDGGDPTHLLVFVAERTRLIPLEYRLPVTAIVRVDDGAVYVDVTGDALKAGPDGADGADGLDGDLP